MQSHTRISVEGIIRTNRRLQALLALLLGTTVLGAQVPEPRPVEPKEPAEPVRLIAYPESSIIVLPSPETPVVEIHPEVYLYLEDEPYLEDLFEEELEIYERDQERAARDQERAARDQEQAARVHARAAAEAARVDRKQTIEEQRVVAEVYQKAYALILDENWSDARQALGDFVRQFEHSKYTDDAWFWLCYAIDKSDVPDEEVFNAYYQFIQDYEKSKWVNDAKANLIVIGRRLMDENRKNKAQYGPIVEQLQKDYDVEVAIQALYGLRRMGDKKSLKAIIDMYDRSDNPALRMKILYTLQRFDDPDAVQKLIDIAKQDPDPEMRKEAINALGHHPSAKVLSVLETILTSADDVTQRRQVIGALRKLGRDGADEVVPILMKVARTDPHVKVRMEAVSALGRIGTPAAQEALIQILEGK